MNALEVRSADKGNSTTSCEGIRESIRLAKAQGLKIMLKPQVYIHRGWVGNLDFHSEKEWIMWEEQYKKYVMIFVQIAMDEHVEMICIGTEIYLSGGIGMACEKTFAANPLNRN